MFLLIYTIKLLLSITCTQIVINAIYYTAAVAITNDVNILFIINILVDILYIASVNKGTK